jgi:hypothetical protein
MPSRFSPLTRRDFVKRTTLAAAVLPAATLPSGSAPASTAASPTDPEPGTPEPGRARLRWLEGAPPAELPGTTWGVAWPRGAHRPGIPFALRAAEGTDLPLQSWPTAYWPDGSLKWTAHATSPAAQASAAFELVAGARPAAPAVPVRVTEDGSSVFVDTGLIRATLPRSGPVLVARLERDGAEIARDGRLLALRQDEPDPLAAAPVEEFAGEVSEVVVEQAGPVRAVVRCTGRHRATRGEGRAWLPFTVRFYFYAGSEAVRALHTFVYDGDEHRDFLRGLGLRFQVPLRDALHDRHVRFAGEGDGLFAEAVRGITGLRRDPGAAVRAAQVAGQPTPPVDTWATTVSRRLHLVPAWGDFTLTQLSADGFQIRKRTQPGHGWIPAGAGRRAGGLAYVGGIRGGLAAGLRDFWQRHPTQLDIREAHTPAAQLTLWLWSPEAPAMDLRFYHDGLGMATHADELQGLEITYEDYEKGFGTPHGIARTSELHFWVLAATPSRERTAAMAAVVRTPPLLAAAPEHLHAAGVFGAWDLPRRDTPLRAAIERMHDRLLDSYLRWVDQHRWYGFWDHGDWMHSYDPDRHCWRYDVGGFAWANSELSPDLWLWYAYLRSGRADVFRLAEAMTRHTGEVDVYHRGRFQGLGTRHNVQHWGCSAKQVRISNAAYRRIHFFLTADERTGDLLRALVDSDQAFTRLDPIRKIRRGPPPSTDPRRLSVGFGTDWGSLAAAWLTEWERTGDPALRAKLAAGLRTLGALPLGLFTRGATFDSTTGEFTPEGEVAVGVSHLSAVFGLVEIATELIELIPDPRFETAWLQYCTLYNASAEEQRAALGRPLGPLNLGQAHARLTAYAAHRRADAALAHRAWQEFLGGAAGLRLQPDATPQRVAGPHALNPIDELPWASTNACSQWGLAAIQLLALVGDHAPADTAP